MRVALYLRVSTAEQAERGFSIAAQKRELLSYANSREFSVVETLSDDGYSGASTDRPGLARLMELADSGEIDGVLAYRRDRLFRSRLYRLLYERDLKDIGVEIIALDDTGNRFGDAIADEVAEHEREQLVERSARGKVQKVRQGKLLAGKRPKYGFSYNEDRSALVPNSAQAAVLYRIFREVGAEAKPMNAVKLALQREGVPTAAGGQWSTQAIRDYILDDAYLALDSTEVEEELGESLSLDPGRYGIWWYNRRRFRKDRHGKQIKEWRPRSEWVGAPVPDLGIPPEWVRLARANIATNRKVTSAGFRFWELSGGIARCEECGRTLTAQTTRLKTGGANGDGLYHYYACRGAYERGNCPGGMYFRARELEEKVWVEVSHALKSPEALAAGLSRMAESYGDLSQMRDREKEVARILSENEAKRARYQHAYAEDALSLDDLRARQGELDALDGEARRELDDMRERRKEAERLNARKDEILEHYSALAAEDLDALSSEERNGLYRRLGLAVSVAKDGTPLLSWDAGISFSEISGWRSQSLHRQKRSLERLSFAASRGEVWAEIHFL